MNCTPAMVKPKVLRARACSSQTILILPRADVSYMVNCIEVFFDYVHLFG